MNSRIAMRTGAFAGVLIALLSLMVSDLHAVADYLLEQSLQAGFSLSGRGFEYAFQLTGLLAWPLLVLASFVYGFGFLAAWKQTGRKVAAVTAVAGFAWAACQVLALVADLRCAGALAAAGADLRGELLAIGSLRGLADLLVGLSGGVVMAICQLLYFRRTELAVGVRGATLVLVAVAAGVAAKTLSLWFFPAGLTAVFLLAMLLKSLGLVLVCLALYRQSREG